jgi:hypothetical protein
LDALVQASDQAEGDHQAGHLKIMGESEFKATPNDLVWADKRQAKL